MQIGEIIRMLSFRVKVMSESELFKPDS